MLSKRKTLIASCFVERFMFYHLVIMITMRKTNKHRNSQNLTIVPVLNGSTSVEIYRCLFDDWLGKMKGPIKLGPNCIAKTPVYN